MASIWQLAGLQRISFCHVFVKCLSKDFQAEVSCFPVLFYSFAPELIQVKCMIEIKDEALRQAAAEGMDAFIQVFADAYLEALGGRLTAENMTLLTGEQHSLLAYVFFRDEVMEGGFVQLVQNGYGPYIFMNPFAKAVRMMGVPRLAALVNKAGKLYRANREDLERERSDEEFMAMYEQYERFDDIQDEFIESEADFAEAIAAYVDANIDQFVDEIR